MRSSASARLMPRMVTVAHVTPAASSSARRLHRASTAARRRPGQSRRHRSPTFAEQEAYLALTAFVAGLKGAGPNPTRQSFMQAMSKITNYDANGLLAPEKISFRDYTPTTSCLWVAQLKGEKFFVVPGTPICSPEVKFNG
jgi:Periplasmic binding protein